MKFGDLGDIEQAHLRKQIHTYAHEISIASTHLGTPRLREKTALLKAITTAALVYSGYLTTIWDEAIEAPETAMDTLATDVRKDEEQRQDDDRKEIGLIGAAIEKTKT